jgi:phospholipase C
MKQWLLFLMMSIITSSICVESVLAQTTTATEQTTTPIKHLIVVVGENHTFDNLLGGYQPRRGQAVSNLLSQGYY